MSALPQDPEIYEREYTYWPWGKLIDVVAAWIEKNAPPNAQVLDYMCGTGFLLNRIATRRADLACVGCCLDGDYVDYARRRYPAIHVELADALHYQPKVKPDIILCAAGLHHLTWSDQKLFATKLLREVGDNCTLMIGEQLLGPFSDEHGRRMRTLELWQAQLAYVIDQVGPADMLAAAVDVLKADLVGEEYKLDMPRLLGLLSTGFAITSTRRTWPATDSEYGDYLLLCRRQGARA